MSQGPTTTIGTARTAVDDFIAAWNAQFAELRGYFDRARIMEQLGARPAA